MKKTHNNPIKIFSRVPVIMTVLLMSFFLVTAVSAHVSPAGCSGSGLGINLFTNLAQANIGDTILYSVVIFNGNGSGPVVCDATGIQASLVTPDGVNHPLVLTRTALSNGQSDFYPNVVSYTAQAAHITPDGTLAATASDTGVIHQNITNSQGGGNQGLNVYVLNTLHIIKQVVNTGGGTAVASDFNLHVKDTGVDVPGSPALGTLAPGTLYSVIAGTYDVSEDAHGSYLQSFSGDCSASGSVTLIGGENKTCTITNTFVPPASINVVKTVINDNGGTKVIADFPLFVNATLVVSGVTNVFPSSASYTVTETSNPGYTQTFSGDCDITGHLSLVPGDIKVCIITNNDIAPPAPPVPPATPVTPPPSGGGGGGVPAFPPPPVPPLIDVVKVPSPLALPDGPGSVTYTYTLRNIGTVPMNNISLVGDTCSPIILVSGDTNGDARLDVNETWVHTCTTTLTTTHTNIVTATGWANGISAIDIASATVVVGVPVIPPLIHITKIPSPLALFVGGGPVTYTYTVTNPGIVALGGVTIADDRCSQISGHTGDVNNDNLLDVSESWTYTCQVNLASTTTNTARVTGTANGITVRDFAVATVVVATIVPRLPNTGLLPDAHTIPWNSIFLLGIVTMLILFFFARRKQTI